MLGSLASTNVLGWLTNARLWEMPRCNISQFYVIKINHRVQMIIDIAELTPKELFFFIQQLSQCQNTTFPWWNLPWQPHMHAQPLYNTHPKWLRTYMLADRVAPWNSLVVYLVRPSLVFVSSHSHIVLCTRVTWKLRHTRVQPVVDSVIGIYKLLMGLDKLYWLHIPKFYIPIFGNHGNNSNTAFTLFDFRQWGCWLHLHQCYW